MRLRVQIQWNYNVNQDEVKLYFYENINLIVYNNFMFNHLFQVNSRKGQEL